MKKHTMDVEGVHTVEVLDPMRNLCGSPTRVESISIWCICWRHHVGRCTHPWRISIIPHGPTCIRISLHWVLTMLFFL